MKEGSIELPNKEILFYRQWNAEAVGKQSTLFFIHGNTSGSYSWIDTIEALQHLNRHMLAIDQRGFGQSTFNTPCNRLTDWAADIIEFCKLKGVSKCLVNGWSFGGGVAMKLAEIAPHLVDKMVLTCSMPVEGIKQMNGEVECKTAEEIRLIPRVAKMLDIFASKNWQAMLQIYETLFFGQIKDYPQEKKEASVKVSVEQRSYVQAIEAMVNSDIDFSKIKAETLVVHGAKDPLLSPALMNKTSEVFKNYVLLPQGGHFIPVQSPKEYHETFVKFIQGK